jgi:hypothetical protein
MNFAEIFQQAMSAAIQSAVAEYFENRTQPLPEFKALLEKCDWLENRCREIDNHYDGIFKDMAARLHAIESGPAGDKETDIDSIADAILSNTAFDDKLTETVEAQLENTGNKFEQRVKDVVESMSFSVSVDRY